MAEAGDKDRGGGSAEDEPQVRMTLGEHLDELRRRLLRGFAALVVAFALAWAFYERLSAVLMRPVRWAVERINRDLAARGVADLIDPRPIATGPMEGFSYALDIALYFGLFVGAPIVIWELWQFVAAGLYQKERRAVSRFVPWSILLFLAGVVFSYFWVAPYVLYYVGTTFPNEELRAEWRISECFDLVSKLCLGMGLIFQLPVAMVFLMRLGLVAPEVFARYRKHFVFGAFVVSAFVSPPDFYSTAAMWVPMLLLYEAGILVGRAVSRPRMKPGSTGGDPP